MKKIVYSLFMISSLAGVLVGCDYQDPNEDKFNATPDAGFVEFSIDDNGTPESDDDSTYAGRAYNANVGCAGAATEIRIPITLYAPVNKNGLDVNYTITDIVGTSAGNVSIEARVPKGENEGEVVVSFSEALNTSVQFTLALSSTDNNNVTIGAPESTVEQSIRVNLNKEQRDQFQGNFNVTRGQASYTASISAGTAPNELIITNLYGPAYAGSQTKVFLQPDGTLSFPAPIDNYLAEDPNVGSLYVQGNSGSYGESCDGGLTMNIRLRYGANLSLQTTPVNIVMTRQ